MRAFIEELGFSTLAGAFWGFVVFVVFAIGGAVIGSSAGQDKFDSFERRDEIRQACIDGNENACRVYEVDNQ